MTTPTLLDSFAATTGAIQPADFTVSAGSNRFLYLFVRYNDSTPDLITGVTYGGQSMTELTEITPGTGVGWIFQLDDDGIEAATNDSFVITYEGSVSSFRHIMHVCSVQDADQSQVPTVTTDIDNNDPMDVTFTALDGLGLAWCNDNHGNVSGTSMSWENSWVEQGEEVDSSDGNVTCSTATKVLTAGSETAQCNVGTTGSTSTTAWISAFTVVGIGGSLLLLGGSANGGF